MPYEEVKEEELQAALFQIKGELTPQEVVEAEYVAGSIQEVVEIKGFCPDPERVLDKLTDNQLRYIVVNSGCYNLLRSAILDILDVEGRNMIISEQEKKRQREGLLEAAVFATTTEPDRQAKVEFS